MAETTQADSGGQAKTTRRKILYIKRKFQRDFILKFCLAAMVAMALASLIVYLGTKDTITASYRYHRLTLEPTGDAILWALLLANSAVFLALLATTIYVTLYVSHKIAGPLYRFEEDIKELANGNLTQRFRLREGDQLKDLVGRLNSLSEGLNKRVGGIKEQVDRIAEQSQEEEWDSARVGQALRALSDDIQNKFILK